MKYYYDNKIAFVIGASEGIGAAVVRMLLEMNCRVVGFSRSAAKLDKLKSQQSNKNLFLYPMDATNAAMTQKVLCEAVNAHGTPFFLMNFAGHAKSDFVESMPDSDVRQMMDVNFFGTYNAVKALSNVFLASGRGHIVNCSSMAGLFGLFGYTAYCASKFAVIGFSESLRREWQSKGIKVSVLCPPNTKTPGLEQENTSKPLEVLTVEEKLKPVTAEFVAEKLLQALPSGTDTIVPSLDGKLAQYLNRLSPRIIDLFTRRPTLT